MILEEFALLASDTARTKAYIQAMIQEKRLPQICIVYSDNISKMEKEAEAYKELGLEKEYFDIDKPILFSIYEAKIQAILIENKDINSKEIENVLEKVKQKYLIYSGYGGYILKSHLFKLNKKFIHIHAGILPKYRGSTTIYYSFLQERKFGATAIFLNEGIDKGEIIAEDIFEIPKENVSIDYVYEPYIRSRLLIKIINQYLENNILLSSVQEEKEEETYFIIHPVLKHLAMLGIEKEQGRKL